MILNTLNAEQREAATYIDGPLLVIAGAGTGKTHMLISRVAYMIKQGISPQSILLLTFTNKAAREMKDRVNYILGEDAAENVKACTFHSFCVWMLRQYGWHIGLDADFTVLAAGDGADIIDIRKAEAPEHKYDKRGFPPSRVITSIISWAVNEGATLDDAVKQKWPKYEKYLNLIKELAAEYDSYKQANAMMDYDDLLLEGKRLLKESPEAAREISNIFQYIMVDEYQDTNRLQDDIIFTLREDNHNLAVVGDDMQSIYAFRGAKVKNIIQFPEKIPGCKTIYLTNNYRSGQEILDLADHISMYATEGFPKSLKSAYDKHCAKPMLLRPYDQIEEADAVMQLIRERHDEGIPYHDICVMFRQSSLTALLESKLNREKIEYNKFGGVKFFDRPYVKDVLSYLRVLSNPSDEIAWFRILLVHAGIGMIYAREIASLCKEHGASALQNNPYKTRQFYKELTSLYNELKKLEKIAHMPKLLEEAIGYYIATNERNINAMRTQDEGRRTELLNDNKLHYSELQILIELAGAYSKITDMLDDLVLDGAPETPEDTDDKLVLTTVHSAKGLEYDTVILLDCIDSVFPSTYAEDAGSKEDNEELRCFYVAVTRAKNRLVLCAPRNASIFGKKIWGKPAHFLNGAQNYLSTTAAPSKTGHAYYASGSRDISRLEAIRAKHNI